MRSTRFGPTGPKPIDQRIGLAVTDRIMNVKPWTGVDK